MFTSLSATQEVVPQMLCFALVEMGVGTAVAYAMPDSPAVVIGCHQIEDNLLEFDLKKGVLRKTGLMFDKRMGVCAATSTLKTGSAISLASGNHRSIDSQKGSDHHHEIDDLKRELISNPMSFALTSEQEVCYMHVSALPQACALA
jgi:hypothetical protein